MSARPTWHQYFMTITQQVAERSTCTRAKVGAVIVRDKNILATGYNGSPAGLPHCTEVGCLIYESKTPNGDTEQNCFRTIHAEMNAIAQGSVDSTIAAHVELDRTAFVYYWLAVAEDYAGVKLIDTLVRERGPEFFLHRVQTYWNQWVNKDNVPYGDLPDPITSFLVDKHVVQPHVAEAHAACGEHC